MNIRLVREPLAPLNWATDKSRSPYVFFILLLIPDLFCFKMHKNICFISELWIVCNNHSFFSSGSVTVLRTDMVKKQCTGVNPSAALDFMKAGKCVSVSSTSFCFKIWYIYQHAGLTPPFTGDLWKLSYVGSTSHQWCMCSSHWSQLMLCICSNRIIGSQMSK